MKVGLKALEIENPATKSKFTSLEGKAAAAAVTDDYLNNDLYIFKIETVANGADGSAYFKLVNKKTKKAVVFNPGGATPTATSLVAITAGDAKDVVGTYIDLFSSPAKVGDKREIVAGTGFKFVPFHNGATGNTNELSLASGAFSVAGTGTGTELQFFEVANTVLTAEDLNDELTGFFSFKADKIAKENNVFEKNRIKAFQVETEFNALINPGEGRVIPEGTYLATSWPEELEDVTEITSAHEQYFRASTFIALSSSENLLAETHKDDQKAGKNFAITTVMGKDLNFYTGSTLTEDMTNGTQMSILNAVFKITTNKDNEYKYAVTVENFRYQKEAGKPSHGQVIAEIGVNSIHSLNTLTTTIGNPQFIFAFNDADVVNPLTLLNSTGKSVYNIQFLSGKNTEERAKYLTVGRKSDTAVKEFEYLAYPSSLISVNAPQSQFVISDVNEENKTITFTNRETGNFFVTKLYNTEKEGEYYVAYGQAYKLGDNVTSPTVLGTALTFTAGNLRGGNIVYDYIENSQTVETVDMPFVRKTIQLVPVSVSKYDGFANNDENLYVNIAFGKNESASSEKVYVTIKDRGLDAPSFTLGQLSEEAADATLFELIKTGEEKLFSNNYAYKRDAVMHEVKSKGDSVAYYTYAIKMFNLISNESYYLQSDPSASLGTSDAPEDAPQFILKNNADGSVSIMPAKVVTDPDNAYNESTNPYIDAFGQPWAASLSVDTYGEKVNAEGKPYEAKSINEIKSYLFAKTIGLSLDPKPQHVAFKAAKGGYLSMTDKNEALLGIKTTADEDLTFRLDTADMDASLPSFYISHKLKDSEDRLFMYYSKDSAEYFKPGNIYELEASTETYKVMFKPATLINSDTLNTVVNDARVNVAEELDGAETLGGLNNFKFNIFKNAEDEDQYVVRCVENKKYLKMENGFITLTDIYTSALRFDVETMSSPVANESLNTSAISVIATNGAVIIKGAQGKKVTISNVLGQAIANTVLSSDNATIAAPAGVVVVAIEGEAAVKAIVK